MKKLFLFLSFSAAFLLAGNETMTVCLRGNTLVLRSPWNETYDLCRINGLGGNKQFNYSYTALVEKKVSDDDLMVRGKYFGRFHWCGDSTGVMHIYPDPARRGVYILSGNHGYDGSAVTMPGHGFTREDIGKKFGDSHWISGLDPKKKDVFHLIPRIRKKDLPKAVDIKNLANFQATRTISRTYLLDGKLLTPNKILKGKELKIIEKTGICTFEALTAAGLKHDKVNDFYAVWDYVYSFYPNGTCRTDCKVTFMRDVCVMGVSPMQDSDMEMGKYDFYEKYIPKMKKFQQKPGTNWRTSQAYFFDGKKYQADTRPYDFAAVQDMTEMRKLPANRSTRFTFLVKGGQLDPADLPDRWIEFLGKVENGKRVRKIGNVLGLDPAYGMFRSSERAKNQSAFILAAWHKTYPSQFSPGKQMVKKGTVLEGVGYRAYFNPEKIGDATVLFVIPHKNSKKVYADFHKPVKDYVLPFDTKAKVTLLECTPGVTLKGNKLTVTGHYGRIVAEVR